MAREKKEKDMSSGYNYMDTYGDMVTLLLTFFVLLFAFSDTNDSKFAALAASITGITPATAIAVDMSPMYMGGNSFVNNQTASNTNQQEAADSLANESGSASGASESGETQEQIDQTFDELYAKLTEYIKENNLGDQLVAQKNAGTITLRVVDGILFDSGKANIKTSEKNILNDIGGMISHSISAISIVEVEGHTDTDPISTAEFKDNWDLSTKRATNTIRYLHSVLGIPYEKLSASGYGEFKPYTTNETAEGKRLNRRVEFIIRRKNVGLS